MLYVSTYVFLCTYLLCNFAVQNPIRMHVTMYVYVSIFYTYQLNRIFSLLPTKRREIRFPMNHCRIRKIRLLFEKFVYTYIMRCDVLYFIPLCPPLHARFSLSYEAKKDYSKFRLDSE